MIDVGRDDGAPARDLAAHELRRHQGGQRRAEALAVGKARLGLLGLRTPETLASDVLALGDIHHLLGDDARAREFELRDQPFATPRFDPRRA